MQFPQPDLRQSAEFAKLILKDKEQRREQALYLEDTAHSSQRKRLPRSIFILLQAAILLAIIVGIIILWHIIH